MVNFDRDILNFSMILVDEKFNFFSPFID